MEDNKNDEVILNNDNDIDNDNHANENCIKTRKNDVVINSDVIKKVIVDENGNVISKNELKRRLKAERYVQIKKVLFF